MHRVCIDQQRVAAELLQSKSAVVMKKLDTLKDLYDMSPSQPILDAILALEAGGAGEVVQARGGWGEEGGGEGSRAWHQRNEVAR